MPDLHGWITQQIDHVEAVVRDPSGAPWSAVDHIIVFGPDAVLRRCTADRKILARHQLDPNAIWYEAPMCLGCGTEGEMGYPVTENLNDCPELLDLAEAHGLTPEVLATLDRPQEGERPEPTPGFGILEAIYEPLIRTVLADVPPALRGPNWKARRG